MVQSCGVFGNRCSKELVTVVMSEYNRSVLMVILLQLGTVDGFYGCDTCDVLQFFYDVLKSVRVRLILIT